MPQHPTKSEADRHTTVLERLTLRVMVPPLVAGRQLQVGLLRSSTRTTLHKRLNSLAILLYSTRKQLIHLNNIHSIPQGQLRSTDRPHQLAILPCLHLHPKYLQ